MRRRSSPYVDKDAGMGGSVGDHLCRKAQVEQVMDPIEFARAWAQGAAMSVDKMIAYAMER